MACVHANPLSAQRIRPNPPKDGSGSWLGVLQADDVRVSLLWRVPYGSKEITCFASRSTTMLTRLFDLTFGVRWTPPGDLLERFPELSRVGWRRGGLPLRVGGWCLRERSVAAITLWQTVWLAPGVDVGEELLLHEFRHVQQFEAVFAFPVRYILESLRHGYNANRFEEEARRYAFARIASDLNPPHEDV
ncbi:MAG: hypothetical protein MNPFHGCM_01597 [Gemmatimonadaceae bacterium]|nr:hypothetical protein [Gemmatimonadaceae bacterium]